MAAAFRVTDQIGLQALTLKALGQHLGVDSTAVYRHFRSKDVLLIAMMDRLLAERLLPSESFTDGRTEV
ncbi:helix-turn-helix domain-containing protein, partial [Staphylococcus aureus]|uniref:helix-turn-helix domain-containing protein n=1 Tax=Staphylococcus aureus TaxID=1280 RepID=UPI0021B14CDF